MMNNSKKLIGYWASKTGNKRIDDSDVPKYLHFSSDVLQWGYKTPSKICVISFMYQVRKHTIETVLPQNPHEEITPFTVGEIEGELKLKFGDFESIWVKTGRQDFFTDESRWEPDPEIIRPDYMGRITSSFTNHHHRLSKVFQVSPQVIAHTDALWSIWQYSLEPFSSFHLKNFAIVLSKGVITNKRCSEKRTLLMYIAGDGHTEATKLLLDNDFEINAQDMYGKTALDYANLRHRTETVKYLISKGAVASG